MEEEEDETVRRFSKRSRHELNEDLPHISDPKRMRADPGATSTTSSQFPESLGESSRGQDSDCTHHSLASIGEAQDVEVQSPHAAAAGLHAEQNLPCTQAPRSLQASETLTYMANFALHFGVTSAMESYLDDLQEISIASSAKCTFKSDVNFLKSELFHPYEYTQYYFCNGCSGALRDRTSVCNRAGCSLRGVTPKRSYLARKASLHLVNLAPQLLLVLRNTIDQLVETHKHIHEETAHAFLSETSDFGLYREDMETYEEFSSKRLNVILTLNKDGVTFKKLTKSQAWPLYVRLEGLAHAQKNSFENMILPGILFTSKTPSRVMLEHLLSRFKRELLALSDQGLDISDRHGSVWKVTPILKNGIVDFSALHILFNSPVWNAEHGCHLCTFAGLKVENRIVWYNENASPAIRRTRASILRDASAELNGLSGRTEMMNLLTMERFRPDALHLISEGITNDLFHELFQSGAKTDVISVKQIHRRSVSLALQGTPNITYATRFILGLENFSNMTGAERDTLMFILFPLVAAENLCRKSVGSVCILIYWLLVRVLANVEEFRSEDTETATCLAQAMKDLWSGISKKLFTLKLHCLLDHSVLEDLTFCGSPFLWSAAPFERMHQQLQSRMVQKKTNCEQSLIENFVLHKELLSLSAQHAERTRNPLFMRMHLKISGGSMNRFPVHVQLNESWYVPASSNLSFEDLMPEHQLLLSSLEGFSFCSRLCHNQQVYSSQDYWTRQRTTMQHCVYLKVENCVVFGNVHFHRYLDIMYSDDEEYTPNYLKLPTSLLEEEELNVDKENVTSSRCKKDRSKGLTGIQERSSIPDMQQSIAMPTCSTSSSHPDLHSLPMPTCSTRSSNSDLHSLHMPTCSTRSNPELHSVAMPTCSSSAVALKQTLGENSLSLSKLGKIVRQFDLGVEDEEYLKSAMANNNIKINMDHIKKLQSNIDGLQTSSDSVVRSLTAVVREQANVIAGMSLTMNILIIRQKELEKEVKRTSYHMARNKEKTLPQGYSFERSNISRNWQLQASPPFKELNMIEVLEKWTKPARAHKHDHFLHVLDFLRHYFINACEPVEEIQKYACRQTGKKGKDDNLKDLPESIVDFLTRFVLDALGLPDRELLQSASEYERNPDRWWLNLATNNEERRRKYDNLSEARMTWIARTRMAMGRALTDVRAYHLDADRGTLLASKKKRPCTSDVTGLNVIQKTDADIAETDANDTH